MKIGRIALGVVACTTAVTSLLGCAPSSATRPGCEMPHAVSAGAGAPLTFVELHWLRDQGGGIEEARRYVDWLRPVAARNQARVHQVFQVNGTAKGELHPAQVWVYELAGPKAMRHLMQDPDYAAKIPTRDRTFDFDRNQLLAVHPLIPDGAELLPPPGWLSFVELHWLKDGGGGIAAARTYLDWVRPLAKAHGGVVAQVFEVVDVPHGNLRPSLVWVYRFPNQQALQGLMQDPNYAANVPNRDRLFDFDRNQLFAVTGMVE